MNRKSIIAILIIVVTGIVIVYSTQYLRERTIGKQDALEAVPLDAVFVLKTSSIDRLVNPLLTNNEVYEHLQRLPAMHRMDTIISSMDAISKTDDDLKRLINQYPFSLSAHKIGRDKINFIYYLSINSSTSKNKIESIFKKYLGKNMEISERKYEGHTISDIQITSSGFKHDWAFCMNKNLLIISPSSILLENALRQMKQEEKIYNNPEFQNVKQTLGKNVDGNVFINYKKLPEVLKVFLKKNNGLSSVINHFSTWAGLDLHIKNDAILLSGFSHIRDSLNSYLNLFADQSPQPIELYNILPANSNTFLILGVDNFSEYILKYNDHLNFLGLHTERKATTEKYQKQYDFSFYDDFQRYFDNEFGFTVTEISSLESSTDLPFVVIKTKSGEKMKQNLQMLIASAAKKQGRNSQSYLQNVRLDEKTNISIFELPINNFSYHVLGHFFDFPENQYATILDNHLVLGVSAEALSKFVYLNILGKTLNSNPVFLNFSTLMSDVTNFFFYTNIPKSLGIYNNLFSDNIVSGIRNNNDVFQKVQAFGIQYNVANNRMFTNVFLQYNQQFNEAAHTVWETLLDTALDFKPVFVQNHYTNNNEIFVQDLQNNIYLVNKVGRVLWKTSLNEQINSEIYQVDYYRNGKLQYLFSTPSELHLIDRNGNYVERYPVALRSKATAGMALFDYDNNYNYRIFIPAQNKQVYLYDIKGNLIEGWTFKGAEHTVNHRVKHFRVGNKDYIVFSDGLRIYILNRRGEVRVNVNELVTKSKNNSVYLDSYSENSGLVTTSDNGTIYRINFNGEISKQQIIEVSENHYFDFEDVDADGRKDYIFLDNQKLFVFHQNGKEIFTKEFQNTATHPPVYYQFSYNDRKIGVTCASENKIYLINNDGSLYNGFPLQGNTLFSIGKLSATSRFNLIVGNSDNFLLNYSVQ